MNGEVNVTAAIAAADWTRLSLCGSIASAIATIAIAGVGLLMLMGRVDFRRGSWTVLGCFLIFEAQPIAQGILAATRVTPDALAASAPPPPPIYPSARAVAAVQNQADASPYASVARPRK